MDEDNQRARARAVAGLDGVIGLGLGLVQDRQPRTPSFDSGEAVILTLFAAAHRTGRAAVDLLRKGWADEAHVLGRSLFEHVIYAYLVRIDDSQRLRFVHYGSSLGRWDELDAYLKIYPDTPDEAVEPIRQDVCKASLRAVEALGLLRGSDPEAQQADRTALAADPEKLYTRLNKAFPKHVQGKARGWCTKNLYQVSEQVDGHLGTTTFMTLYRLLYANASRVVHSDPSTVGMIRRDDVPTALLLGPDPRMTVPVATALGQLLLAMDELLGDVFALGLEQELQEAMEKFVASVQGSVRL